MKKSCIFVDYINSCDIYESEFKTVVGSLEKSLHKPWIVQVPIMIVVGLLNIIAWLGTNKNVPWDIRFRWNKFNQIRLEHISGI